MYNPTFPAFRILTLVISFSVLLVTWQPVEAQSDSAGENLVGLWKNITIRVEMKTYKGSDSSAAFIANERNWNKTMNIKPIRTHIKEDGSYISRYYSPDDSLVMERRGNWKVHGDTLVMQETHPADNRYVAWFNLKGDTVRFRRVMDWDKDGEADDQYTGVQVRVK